MGAAILYQGAGEICLIQSLEHWTWTAIWHFCKTKKSILQSNKRFCLYVCLKLNNYRTAGLIWLNFYLLAQSLSRDGFRPTKPDPGSGFSKNPEKPILAGKGEYLAATLCRGGGVVTTYLELLSSNLVCKPNLGANFDF